MNLRDAYDLAWTVRTKWIHSRGKETLVINMKHVLRIVGEQTEIATIKPSTFTRLGQQLLSEGKAPGTANRIMANLHTCLTECHLEEELDHVPTYRRLPEPPPLKDFYTKDELKTLLQASLKLERDALVMQRALLFFYYTGCRKGELLNLKWQNTDRFGRNHQCVDLGNRRIKFLDTKNGSHHEILIHDDLLPVLEEMNNERIDEDNVFNISRDRLNNRMNDLKELTGLGGRRAIHQIRHSTATHLVEAGEEIRAIQALLNHSNIETTLKYAKATDEVKARAINNISMT